MFRPWMNADCRAFFLFFWRKASYKGPQAGKENTAAGQRQGSPPKQQLKTAKEERRGEENKTPRPRGHRKKRRAGTPTHTDTRPQENRSKKRQAEGHPQQNPPHKDNDATQQAQNQPTQHSTRTKGSPNDTQRHGPLTHRQP